MNRLLLLFVCLVLVFLACTVSVAAPDPSALTGAHDAVHHLQSQATVRVSGYLSQIASPVPSKVYVADGTTLYVDTTLKNAPTFELLNDQGNVQFTGQDAVLKGSTIIVDHTGRLTGSPVKPTDRVTIGLTRPDGTLDDPSSIGGGLIVMGNEVVYGATKDHAVFVNLTSTGFRGRAPRGWLNGDWVVIGRAHTGEQAEYRQIIVRSNGVLFVENGQVSPLQYSHGLADGSFCEVCNLTRNVRVVSMDRSYDPHTMWMGDPKTVVGWELDGIGRSRVEVPGEKGRYSFHFPHRVIGPATPTGVWHLTDSTVWDSFDHKLPGRGVVNHGDRVVGERLVVAGTQGPSFYGENGLEQGSWNDSVSIDASGIDGLPVQLIQSDPRAAFEDFAYNGDGFAGHGGIDFNNCRSYGAKTAGINLYATPLKETGAGPSTNPGKVNGGLFVGSDAGIRAKYFQKGRMTVSDVALMSNNRAIYTHYMFGGFTLQDSDLIDCVSGFKKESNNGDKFILDNNYLTGYVTGFEQCDKGGNPTSTTITNNLFEDGAVDVRLFKPVSASQDRFINGISLWNNPSGARQSVMDENLRVDGMPVYVVGP